MPLTLRLVNETTLPNGGPVSIQLSGQHAVGIGRAVDLSWTLPDPARFVSNKHCEIRYQDGGYWLYDVSSNGTFLNGAVDRMRAPRLLRNGDRFAVGHYLVAVTLDGAEEVAAETLGAPIASPAYVPGGRDLWADETDFQPAIGPKEFQPAQNGPVDWLADIPIRSTFRWRAYRQRRKVLPHHCRQSEPSGPPAHSCSNSRRRRAVKSEVRLIQSSRSVETPIQESELRALRNEDRRSRVQTGSCRTGSFRCLVLRDSC